MIAADNALFSITEVRWGLTAAIIIPQLSDAISVRQLRRYALTGERFGATEAQRIGLAHLLVPAERLAAAGEELVGRLLENAPAAMAETKATTLQSAWGGFDRRTFDALAEAHARSARPLKPPRPRLFRREACGGVVARSTPAASLTDRPDP